MNTGIFVLIVMWVTGGGYSASAVSHEFQTMEACQTAVNWLQQQKRKPQVAVCVPKGEK